MKLKITIKLKCRVKSLILSLALMLSMLASLFSQAVDYNLSENWMCHPMKTADVSRLPMNVFVQSPDLSIENVINYPQPTSDTGVDVFYIYPTLDLSLIPKNVDLADIDTSYAKYVFRMQAGLTAQFGRVFVPYHRQASLGTFILAGNNGQANILDTAFQDIKASFNHYMANYNNGNKIILIGHSQGSYHLQALLRQFFDNDPDMLSKLVVAIPGGNYFYTAQGERNGGSLENIEVCPPLESGYQCGCVMTWRSYDYGGNIPYPAAARPYFNPLMVENNFFYSVFDSVQHEVKYFDFGYDQYDTLTRFIALNPIDSVDYIGWENMYAAELNELSLSKAGLMCDNIQESGDLRPDPLTGNDFHNYDFQIVQADMLNILADMIVNCSTTATTEEILNSGIKLYPNPSSHLVQVKTNGQKIKHIKLFNLQGKLLQEHNSNVFSIVNLPIGVYWVSIQTNESINAVKLIRH